MRRLPVALVVLLLLMVAVFALANGESRIRLVVDGKELHPTLQPRMIDGHVMVPLRTVAEALGADVDWNADTRTVTITRGSGRMSGSGTGPYAEAEIDRQLGPNKLFPDSNYGSK